MGTVIVALALVAIIGLIVWSMVKDKKKGKSSCGAGCAHCAMHGQCHHSQP